MVSKLKYLSSRLLIIFTVAHEEWFRKVVLCNSITILVPGLAARCQKESELPVSPTACGEGCWQWIIWVLWVVGWPLVGFKCLPDEPDQASELTPWVLCFLNCSVWSKGRWCIVLLPLRLCFIIVFLSIVRNKGVFSWKLIFVSINILCLFWLLKKRKKWETKYFLRISRLGCDLPFF